MITQVRHAGLVVADIKNALEFWCDVLGFKVVTKMEESGPHMDAMMVALPTWAEHTVATRPDHFHLDLAGVNRAILTGAGVRPDRIADEGP